MQIEYFLDLLLSLIQWASSSQGNIQSRHYIPHSEKIVLLDHFKFLFYIYRKTPFKLHCMTGRLFTECNLTMKNLAITFTFRIALIYLCFFFHSQLFFALSLLMVLLTYLKFIFSDFLTVRSSCMHIFSGNLFFRVLRRHAQF